MAGVVIDDIKKHIDNGNNFLLSGGAGSGKTYTLMQVLDLIHEKNPVANIACITYTNVAVDEIKSRSPYENLRVSTIHDFLWDVIKSYQPNIKKSLDYLITWILLIFQTKQLSIEIIVNWKKALYGMMTY